MYKNIVICKTKSLKIELMIPHIIGCSYYISKKKKIDNIGIPTNEHNLFL